LYDFYALAEKKAVFCKNCWF